MSDRSALPIHLPVSPPDVPGPPQAQVWLDFDGTISRADVLDTLIQRFAINDSWKLAEERWQAGLIGSRECLELQFAAVRANQSDLDDLLSSVSLDPGILRLLNVLRQYDVPAAVVSDGIDLFINALFDRHEVDRSTLPVRSNTLTRGTGRNAGVLRLKCPHHAAACDSAAAHCKCASMAELGTAARRSIYVGDGRSDLCAARKCEVVFAKGALAACLTREGRPFLLYATLDDVAAVLENEWSGVAVASKAG